MVISLTDSFLARFFLPLPPYKLGEVTTEEKNTRDTERIRHQIEVIE